MAGTPGKNKIETGFRLIVAGQDLSSDLVAGSFSGGGITLDQVDLHGVGDAIKTGLTSWGNAPLSAKFHMNDTATTGAFTVLKGIAKNSAVTITAQYGSLGAAPDTGDPEWEGSYIFLGFKEAPESGRHVLTANWIPAPGSTPAWGTVS